MKNKKLMITGMVISMAVFAGACGKKVNLSCGDSIKSQNLLEQKSFIAVCPADCSTKGGSVWGTDKYTTDSSICKAAVHSGAIDNASGGNAKVEVIAGESSYTGSVKNGVSTSNWGSYQNSFTVK